MRPQVQRQALEDPASANRFWRGHMVAGFVILGTESVASVVYLLTSRGTHRSVLIAMASVFALVAVAGAFASTWTARQSWRHVFSLSAALVCIAALCVSAWLDGGLDSPFLYMSLLPIMYTALLLRPRAVTVSGMATLVGVFAVGMTDADVSAPQESILMMAAVVGGAFGLAVISAAHRDRLEADRMKLINRLHDMAATDLLTGCLNQHLFHQRLSEEFDRARRYNHPLSLIVCDVDLFKAFNDSYGHERGDRALSAIAERLRGVMRSSDVVARIGGDEFAVLLPETERMEANRLAQRVIEAQASLRPDDPPPVSLGVAQLGPLDPSPVALFNRADFAMYSAKAEGRGGATEEPGQGCPVFPDHVCPDSRRAAEAARREQRHRLETETILETLLEEVPVGFALIDSDLRVLRANGALIASSGDTTGDHIGLPLEQVIPQWWPTVRPHVEQLLHDGTPVHNLELDETSAPGTPSVARLANFYPVHLNGGTTGIGIVIVDITERKQLEQSEELLTDAVVCALAAAAEARDPYTAGHQRRVADISAAITTELGYDTFTTKGIRLAASIHDIGKIAIPAEILTKPTSLTPAEFELLKSHARAGYDMLAGIQFPWPVADMVLQHHERLDGSGYPHGLEADQIGPGSRIIAVADVVEAMMTHRPYRTAPGIEAAIAAITAGRGTLFDPDSVDLCIRLISDGVITLGAPLPPPSTHTL